MFRLLAAIAAVLALSGPVLAADPIVDETGVVDSTGAWTGAYVGLLASYGAGDFAYSYDSDDPVVLSPRGPLGGVTAGYNWQHGPVVLGIEGDISLGNLSDEVLLPMGAPCFIEGCTADLSWVGTVRGRVGYTIGDLMPYVTGGVAVAGIAGSADFGACDYTGSCAFDRAAYGMTFGAGFEWSFTEQFSVKAEYLYANFGDPNFEVDLFDELDASTVAFSTARVGVNFHF